MQLLHSPPAIPVTMEAIPDGPVPLSPSMVIFDWLLILCFSSAFSASSWSMSACRASIVSSNSLQRRGQHHTIVDLSNLQTCSYSYFSFFFSRVWASSSRVWIFSTRSSASLDELSSFFSSRLRRTFASLSSSPWKSTHTPLNQNTVSLQNLWLFFRYFGADSLSVYRCERWPVQKTRLHNKLQIHTYHFSCMSSNLTKDSAVLCF